MHWIIGVSDASSISIGRILSPMMWFGHVQDNRSCQILSVDGACPSLVNCAVPTPVKTTPELSGPAFGVLPKTGVEEPEDRRKWLRTVEDDLRPLTFGLATARRRTMDRPAWRLLVDAARSSWHAPERVGEREMAYCNFVAPRVMKWPMPLIPQFMLPNPDCHPG